MPRVMSGEDIHRTLRRIAHEILETHHGPRDVVIIGIHTRGAYLARDLAATIGKFEETEVPLGVLDIGLYRDDRDIRPVAEPRSTEVPPGITGKHIVLVDDVLYTGRTVRAALDALSDIGRSLTTELAVLIDRGHRELPIRADYVGKNVPTASDEIVRVRLAEVDGVDGVWIEKAPG